MPYDIVLMKNRLGISSEEFLIKYTYYHIDEKTSHIFVMLKTPCPFLKSGGCSIYTDRPFECRYFPVGVYFIKKVLGKEVTCDVEYVLNLEEFCIGIHEDSEWTIETWRTNQGIDVFDDLYREWNEILLMADISGRYDKAQIYIVGYDLDRFRRFIFKSRFLDIVSIEEEEINKIKTNDTVLMKFGFKYLKHIFNIEKTLKLKENNELQFEQIIREIRQIR